MWTKDANRGLMNWSDAVTYCNNLDYAGYTDWRLPNVNELESLINAENNNPALPSDHPFTNVGAGGRYWSSSTFAADTSKAWIVDMGNGNLFVSDKLFGSFSLWFVWPVRAGQ
jgi:hypothetical protein